MDRQYILRLFTKKILNEATDEELAKLAQWQQLHPEDELSWSLIDAMKGVVKDENDQVIDVKAWAEKRWDRILPEIKENESHPYERKEFLPDTRPQGSRFFKRHWYIAAAVVAVIMMAGILTFLVPSIRQNGTEEVRLVAEDGKRFDRILPDGTHVWLNSGSSLTFSQTSKKNREANLAGEAYFDVYPNEKEPFIIHTEKQDIHVLGTKLEVKAYQGDGIEETTLLSGSIRVSIKEGKIDGSMKNAVGNRNFRIEPGRKIVLSSKPVKGEGSRPVSGVTADGWQIHLDSVSINGKDSICDDVAWIYGKLVFNKERFSNLAREMERWYNVKIIFQNETLKKEIFSGAFDKQDITEALKALQLTTDFSFRQQGNNIYLW